jgi:predicted CXXCH cytochrome family protein
VPAGALPDPAFIQILHLTSLPDHEGNPALGGAVISAVDLDGAAVSFASAVSLRFAFSGLDFAGGADPQNLSVAELNGSWTTLPSSVGTSSVSASIRYPGTYGVVEQVPATKTVVTLTNTSDAPTAGRHRIDPGSTLAVAASITPASRIFSGSLVETVPVGWTLRDPGTGTWHEAARTLTWPLVNVRGGTRVVRTFTVDAPPLPLADGSATMSYTFSAQFLEGPGQSDPETFAVLVAPPVLVAHSTVGQVPGPAAAPVYLAADTPILDQQRFEVFRVRFEVSNPDTVPATFVPQLWFRAAFSTDAYAVVPSGGGPASPFHVAEEWIPAPGGGTMIGPDGAWISAASLVGDEKGTVRGSPVDGYHSMGANPLPAFSVAGMSFTTIEFSVSATVDAAYLTWYLFRMTDAATPLAGATAAVIRLGDQPLVVLSPGQRSGDSSASVAASPPTTRYRLSPAGPTLLGPTPPDPIHGPYSLTTDACAACHRSHSSQGPSLLKTPTSQLTLCATCHSDPTNPAGAANIATDYSAAPANDPFTRSYFLHDPTAGAVGHLSAESDVFAGVSNRHAECADCHNPHRADANTDAAPDTAGWTTSSRTVGATGVSVANGAAGSAPTYTLVATITKEYQLCFKCHSGYTQLLPNAAVPFSQFELDKGIEFNPANLSYHPVEAAGKNGTTAMTNGLVGTSPYKLWDLTTGSTVRCLNCHADSAKVSQDPGISPRPGTNLPTQDASLPDHASQNRGILILPYRDRTLKSSFEGYAAADFALCYACHAEAPFVDATGNVQSETNFRYHGLHVSALQNRGSGGTSIDATGGGQGDAVCAECHFRIHGTALAVKPGDANNARLVNFAPNVDTGSGGWASTGVGSGTCALTCHGYVHSSRAYGTVPLAMTLTVTMDRASFGAAGDPITFTYAVTNAGSSTLVGPITITDDHVLGTDGTLGHEFVCASGDLTASAETTCTGTYTTVESDVTAGSVLTTATAHAGATDSNTARVTVHRSP